MFLRFYSQTDEKIDECIEKLKKNAKGLIKVEKNHLSVSCNIILPLNTPSRKNIEVILTFDTDKHSQEFYDNKENKDVYMKYAIGEDERKKGDIINVHFQPIKQEDVSFYHGK